MSAAQDEQAPPAVTQREIVEILRTFGRSHWRSLHLEIGPIRITVGKDGPPTAAELARATAPAAPSPEMTPATAVPAPPTAVSVPAPGDTTGLIEVRSPAVGSFWLAPNPGSPPFVQVGQAVEVDEQLAIVEVMKLMNPVAAPQAGVLAQVCAANAEMVEFDQVLFLLRPVAEAPPAGSINDNH